MVTSLYPKIYLRYRILLYLVFIFEKVFSNKKQERTFIMCIKYLMKDLNVYHALILEYYHAAFFFNF